MDKTKATNKAVVALFAVCLTLALAITGFGMLSMTRANAAGDDLYVIPIDGYYTGEEGGNFEIGSGSITMYFTTNRGINASNEWQGLGVYGTTNEWQQMSCDDNRKLEVLTDICDHLLINGKTMSEIRVEHEKSAEISIQKGGTAFCRVVFQYGGTGDLRLTFHTDAADTCLGVADVNTITLKKGFRFYNNQGVALGVGTPCDYTMTVADKPQTSSKMWVRQVAALSIQTPPTKTEYLTTESFAPDGMVLRAEYVDGGTAEIAVKSRMIGDYTMQVGTVSVPVSYNGKTVNYDITVNAPAKTLTEITATGNVTAEQYGEVIDFSGVTVTGTYVDSASVETQEEITLDKSMISITDVSALGDTTATITVTEGTTVKTTTVPATIVENTTSKITGIEAGAVNVGGETSAGAGWGRAITVVGVPAGQKGMNNVQNYDSMVAGKKNGDLVIIGDKTFAQWKQETSKGRIMQYGTTLVIQDLNDKMPIGTDITIKAGFIWYNTDDGNGYYNTNFDSSYSGEVVALHDLVFTQDAYFTYAEKGSEKHFVNTPVSITATYGASVEAGDTFNVSSVSVIATLKKGGTETIDGGFLTFEGNDFSEVGDKTVTVNYAGRPTTFTVTVAPAAKKLASITLDGTVTVKQYEEPDYSRLTVTANYENDTPETIALSDCTLGTVDTWTKGTKSLTVTYRNKYATVDVTVGDPDLTKGMKVKYDNGANTNNGGLAIDVEFVGVGDNMHAFALGNVSGLEGSHILDYLLLDNVSATELLANGKIARVNQNGKRIVIHMDAADYKPSDVKTITFKAGYQWVGGTEDYWGTNNWGVGPTYYNYADAVIKEDITLYNLNTAGWTLTANTVSVKTAPTKTSYVLDEPLNVSGLVLDVKLSNGDRVDYTVTGLDDPRCEFTYDLSAAGTKTVLVSYLGIETSFEVSVSDEKVIGLEMKTAPTKTQYMYGFYKIDLAGAEFELTVKTPAGDVKRAIENSSLTVADADPYTLGTQSVKVSYIDVETSFDIEMVMSPDTYGLYVNYSDYMSVDKDLNDCLMVDFNALGELSGAEFKAIWLPTDLDHTLDYIEINGVSVSDLHAQGLVTRIATYGRHLIFHFDSTLQPSVSHKNYEEGDDVVNTITIKKGFQMYKPTDGKDHWGDTNATYEKIEGGVLKETVTLYNNGGFGWTRMLKTANGVATDDALTIKSMPSKTVYAVGESLDIRGLLIHVKYLDGGEEDLVIGTSEIEGFRPSTVGKQTLTFSYGNDDAGYAEVSFEIEVKESVPAEENEGGKKKCGCGSSVFAPSMIIGGMLLIGALLPLCFRRKSKKEKPNN